MTPLVALYIKRMFLVLRSLGIFSNARVGGSRRFIFLGKTLKFFVSMFTVRRVHNADFHRRPQGKHPACNSVLVISICSFSAFSWILLEGL